MYYVLNVAGYETYYPIWFYVENCSKTKYQRIVREAVNEVLPELLKDDGYIDGLDIMNLIIPILEREGLTKLNPDFEVSLNGECLYRRGKYQKPKVIPRDAWKQIVEHNEEVDKKLYERLEK
jgi:hypothetical protein